MTRKKLLYIYMGGSRNVTSIHLKSRAQVRGMNEAGIDTHGYFFTEKVTEEEKLDDQLTLMPLPEYTGVHRYFQADHLSQFNYSHVLSVLKERAKDFDFIFLRHIGNGPAYEELLEFIAHKTLLYVPSNRIRERYCERRYTVHNSWASAFFGWWEYFTYWRREKRLMKKFYPRLKGIVTFTPEFGRIIQRESSKPMNIIYNRHGVDTAQVPARSSKQRTGEEVKLIFLKGSATEQRWAGIERLMRSIEAYPQLKFKLYITGNAYKQPERYDKPFVSLTGRLPFKELDALIDEVDLGVSNLENYLIHFEETTNLKSRDYYSRGLPFIQSNTMPDIEGTEAAEFYLYIPNDDSIIDMQAVFDFAIRMRENQDHPEEMHRFAVEHLDWGITTGELAKEILAS